ncbi:MAG TPA: MlaD family protein [Solirubrobacteraceae bacterium]|jgi:ABC-type transporter Mla subunit MlaD|nr:MlaD family protein [Solirubrobacteraceae bacterium]
MSGQNGQLNGAGGPAGKPRRRLLDIVPGQHKPKLVRTGLIFSIITLIFLYVIYTKPPLPFSGSGTTVKADFKYAADVSPGRTPVRVDGIDVGVVTGQRLLAGKQGVQLTMTLNSNPGFSVKQDAQAALRWRTLLGLNYYVDLTPGSPSAPALGGGVIPTSRTSSQVELDQVLEPLDAQGRSSVQTMIDQFNAGFSDPNAVKSTIHATAPAMQNLAAGLPGLRGTDPGVDLPTLVSSTNKWMGRLARDEVNLGNLVTNGATALSVTSANAVDLGSTFDQAPAALTQTRLTMARLRTTLRILNPIAQQLEPGAQKLYRAATLARTAVADANPLLVDLKPTLAAIKPSVASLATTARAGVPVVNSLSSTVSRTQSTFIPFLNDVNSESTLKNYEVVGPALASVDSVLSYGDKFGTLAGFEAGVGENVLSSISPCSTYITDPDVTQKIDCEAVTQLLSNIFNGTPITQALRSSPEPENLVQKVLGALKK